VATPTVTSTARPPSVWFDLAAQDVSSSLHHLVGQLSVEFERATATYDSLVWEAQLAGF